jgi:hypothetical protein
MVENYGCSPNATMAVASRPEGDVRARISLNRKSAYRGNDDARGTLCGPFTDLFACFFSRTKMAKRSSNTIFRRRSSTNSTILW